MSDESEIERRLTRIEVKQDRVENKLDRIINGQDGQDGMFTRLTKSEQRHGFVLMCYGWLVVWTLSISAGLIWVATIVFTMQNDQK